MATHGEKRRPPAGKFSGRLRGASHGRRHVVIAWVGAWYLVSVGRTTQLHATSQANEEAAGSAAPDGGGTRSGRCRKRQSRLNSTGLAAVLSPGFSEPTIRRQASVPERRFRPRDSRPWDWRMVRPGHAAARTLSLRAVGAGPTPLLRLSETRGSPRGVADQRGTGDAAFKHAPGRSSASEAERARLAAYHGHKSGAGLQEAASNGTRSPA